MLPLVLPAMLPPAAIVPPVATVPATAEVPPITVRPPLASEPPVPVRSPLPDFPPVPDDETLFEDELQARRPRQHAKAAKAEKRFMRILPCTMVSPLVLRASGIVALIVMAAPRSAGAALGWCHEEMRGSGRDTLPASMRR
jgi:hypothetical protein